MAPPSPATIADLVAAYLTRLRRLVDTGKRAAKTVQGYQAHLSAWLDSLPGGDMPLSDVAAHHLPEDATWHRIQAVQCLFNWARKPPRRYVLVNPFEGIQKPALGVRQRTLTREESRRLLRACDQRPTRKRLHRKCGRKKERKETDALRTGAPVRPTRWFLVAMARTGARPGELRALRWCDWHEHLGYFALTKFKAKDRREDGVRARVLLVDSYLARVLRIWRERRRAQAEDFIFLNRRGKAWTKDALGLAIRRAREAAGLEGRGVDAIVCYTQRHTAATRAAQPLDGSPGASEFQLAVFLGHSNPATCRKYVHLGVASAREVQAKATAVRRHPKRNGS